jgi:trehalose 6-phosphate phosphatase
VAVLRRVRGWRRQLEAALAGVPGIHFEDKQSTLAIHYGLARAWRGAEQAVYAAANRLSGTRLVPGKRVLNVLPRRFPDKGDALRALLARLGLGAALYLGDDVTDEDAFARDIGVPCTTVRVGGAGPSRARYRLEGQGAVDTLLEVLLGERLSSGPGAAFHYR